MGSRYLKKSILFPLIDKTKLEERYDIIDKLKKSFISTTDLRKYLNDVYDLERLVGRISYENANPRDLLQLKISLSCLPKLNEMSKTLLDKKGVKIIDADSDAELQAKMLNNDYVLFIEEFVNKWRKEVEKEQLKLDSVENYIIESKICAEINDKNEE